MKHLNSDTHDLSVFTSGNKTFTGVCMYTYYERGRLDNANSFINKKVKIDYLFAF